MTRVILDAALDAKLKDFREPVEVCDSGGRTLGVYHPLSRTADPTGARDLSPFSDEEIERRRQQRTGRPLAEIIEGLADS